MEGKSMGDFLDDHIEEIIKGMPTTKEIIQQEFEDELKRLNMFRLLSLTILHHRILGNTKLNFCQDVTFEQYPEEIYTSVVIGVNGIGKSYLMRAIADIFSYLDGLMAGREYKKSPLDYKFSVKYRIGIANYEFTNIEELEPAGRARRNYMHTTCKRNAEEVRIGQMMDYYFLLRKAKDESEKLKTKSEKFLDEHSGLKCDKKKLTSTLRYLNLYRFAGAVMWVLHEVLGLEEKYLIVPVDERRGKALLKGILNGGNFGQHAEFFKRRQASKNHAKRFMIFTANSYRHFDEYPSDVFFDTIFRFSNYFRKQSNNKE